MVILPKNQKKNNMPANQRQDIGDNSTGIQVQGDYIVGTSYTEIKTIFMDLFQLNFPRIQDISAQIANERFNLLLDELKLSFEKHKQEIDPTKFVDPSIQYEMQSMAINVARRGDKSNIKLLTELLCTVASNDCPELIELISSESLRIAPMLSKKHLAYLSLEVLVNDATIGSLSAVEINEAIRPTLEYISESENITFGDLQYIACTGAIETRGIIHTGITPNFIKETPDFKDKKPEEIKSYCVNYNLTNILKIIELIDKLHIGHYQLMAVGKLIAWVNLSQFTNIDVRTLFS